MGANETFVVFRSPLRLKGHISAAAVPAIVMVSHGRTAEVTQEVILLVVPTTEEFESTWVRVVAHSLQDHVVTLCDGTVADIFHALNERQSASVSALGLFLQMHGKGRLVVDVVSGPEVHRNDPEDAELSHTAPNVWHIVEKL